jgi:hypothetical protein
MKLSLGAGIAALLAGAALAATPAMAQMHGGGGFHGGAGFHGGSGGRMAGGFRGGGFSRSAMTRSGFSGWRGGHHHDDDDFIFVNLGFAPWGFWGDPFYWDWGYPGYPDDADYGYDAATGPPPASAPPAGYDCDGWRWDAAANRYVAAKVSCD